MKINEYLNVAKNKLKINSDAQLGIQLGVTRASVSSWRTGRTAPDDYACFQIANVLMIDPRKVIADAKYEVEKDIDRKEFWEETSKEYGYFSTSYALFSAFCSLAGAGIYYILCKIDYPFLKSVIPLIESDYMSVNRYTKMRAL